MSPAPTGERRGVDRRTGDRRHLPRSAPDDSWFGVFAEASVPGEPGDGGIDAALYDSDAASESRFLTRETQRIVATEGTALRRILRAYVIARAALGAALVLAPWAASLMGGRPPVPLLLVCLAYASQAISLWLLSSADEGAEALTGRSLRRQWLQTIGVDLLAFSTLRLLEPAASLNYAALLVLPALMAGVLTKRLVALATAALVSLVLLAGAWIASGEGGDLYFQLSQAGLAGAGIFVITLLAGELAQRLSREERAARGSLGLARQQAQLNRLVIEEMTDGVLVVDRRGRVRAANPAARLLLGPIAQSREPPFPLSSEPSLQALERAVEAAYVQGSWPDDARELVLSLGGGETRSVQVRVRFTRRRGIDPEATSPEDICVLFLEDLRVVQSRVRQEKLAAMGRVSVGIAHEIRNPLAAISQANALMREDALAPPQQRLATIIGDNVERLKRIVDDVMAVAPGASAHAVAIDAVPELRRTCDDWVQTNAVALQPQDRLQLQLPAEPQWVMFDVDHLRRVLVNLLDNAARHASTTSGAMQLRLVPATQGAMVGISVSSDGPPIAADVERHLFEPFFSTRSRGSGLGLYICRELCARYGASIEFRPGPPGDRHRNVFRIAMRRANAPAHRPNPP